jgi:putative oxygen-independent coproporphyrinogen III oxidase
MICGAGLASDLALYIHWPFCVSKCPYCDFNSHVREKVDVERFKRAYFSQISDIGYQMSDIGNLTSIFFGGGTPSLMPPELVADIISSAKKHFTFASDIEITLEANPNSAEAKKFKEFKEAGVNRVSIGVQSLRPENLKFLQRAHNKNEALEAIEMARATFHRYSFDLIYALPNQTPSEWEKELKEALKLAGGHLSLYQLTIEKGTQFYSDYHKGKFKIPDSDNAAELYELTNDIMEENGYDAYEVSNYARTGHESQHNLTYWRYGHYAGIGAGAHGRLHLNGKVIATQNIAAPELWLEAVEKNNNGLQQSTELSEREVFEEIMMMGLRIKEGAKLHPLLNQQKTQKLVSEGLVELTHTHIRTTKKGRILLQSVLNYLL